MPHIHDKIDFTVEVFVVYKSKVLLRIHDKLKVWLSVGGHIESNEDPNKAAVREVKEEVGLDVVLDDSLLAFREQDNTKELIPPYFLNRNRIPPTHEHVTLVYFARALTDKLALIQGREKSDECRWFSKKDLQTDKKIIPNVKFYALKALEKLSTA
ncbi:NUDIX hydrolase [Candidatus Roizmanbacteria bacterium CG_4_10_14_0_8_um_filter_39_9]|uniref:NUDIX hydrolase n=1 Tax=Candidatus Roizmanbacteria bacterium CG_4_10_14_0_8_um_filter_39_9 TaxID=1974829 RepID=A0A2M7QEH2_9BACT|nr:MAG: NUDIX hydrolase [Candidatus Roizmanbacteria bacterium CG_4_10_14_0_8_um_filter_39_9]